MFQILIVEDDKELSQLFQKVLEKNGYQVKSASDGALALEILDKEYIDLIISDIMMPVMDGYELVSELRSAGYQIPVLMITAKGSFDDMRQGFLSGSDDYMVKPVNVNEMVLRVGALLRRTRGLRAYAGSYVRPDQTFKPVPREPGRACMESHGKHHFRGRFHDPCPGSGRYRRGLREKGPRVGRPCDRCPPHEPE